MYRVLIFLHDAPADVVDVHFLPVQSPRPGANIGLYIFKQPVNADAVGAELDTLAVAESIFNAGCGARGLRASGVQIRPSFWYDLIDMFLGRRFVVVFINFPVCYRMIILSAVFISLGQGASSITGITAVVARKHGLEHQNKVKPIRQIKTPHPHCQFGNGFGIG